MSDTQQSGETHGQERTPPSRGVLTRTVKTQLILFVIITLAGISYVSANYVGLTKMLSSAGCTVHVDLPDSGGIFTGAEVTYRGVTVGQVGGMRLIPKGIQADLLLNDCSNPKIPSNSSAIVSDRSVVGEQYVNLVPTSGSGPYLSNQQTIPMSRTKLPVSAEHLLTNIDALVNSIDLPALRTAVTELGDALSGRGQDLGNLLDASHAFLNTASANLTQTIALLRSSDTVLSTQLDEGNALRSFTHNLNLLSRQLRISEPDIRRLLDDAPSDLAVVRSFVQDNRTDLGAVIANLAVTGETLLRHVDGVTQILELYPNMTAGGLTVMHPSGTQALGFILGTDPPDCGDPKKGGEGYGGTDRRQPSDVAPKAPNVAAHCTAPPSSGTNVRGSANVPGGDPISTSGGGVAYPRANTAATTGEPIVIGTGLDSAALVGDRSWLAILTTALS